MKVTRVRLRSLIRESIRTIYEAAKDYVCPPATQDVAINTKNRNATRKNHMYGPLNIDFPGRYWKKIAKKWDTTEEAAKNSLCGNCVAFDISPRMDECMPGEVSEDEDGGRLGYCWMHHFKCHSLRSCDTWARGGPISEDDVSYGWQDKNAFPGVEVNEFVDGSYGMRGRTVPMGAIIKEKS